MQAKTTAPKSLVSVYAEKGVLAFRFSSKYNPLFEILDGKAPNKQKTMGLGLRESAENWKLAQSAALRIERDLSDSENWQLLFDPTFVKYGLAVKYTSAALKLAAPIPEVEPELTVGAMWEDYLQWKKTTIEETTFHFHYLTTFTNVIKGMVWNKSSRKFVHNEYSIYDKKLSELPCFITSLKASDKLKSRVVAALSEAFKLVQSQGKTKLTVNPFVVVGGVTENKTDKYKSTVNANGETQEWWDTGNDELTLEDADTRAFTKDERDIIIKAFYESDKPATCNVAPLVEFLFLTGCRPGEVFALRWQDVFIGRTKDYVRFSKSYNGRLKNTQQTKTGEVRLFKMYPKLRELLLRIKSDDARPNDLVFINSKGASYNSGSLYEKWVNSTTTKKGIKYIYPGVVTQLANDGLIGGYLSPYHTRHTFITLQAHAGTDLLLLATACGNSVEVIQRHYLGIDTTVKMTDI